MLKRFGILFYIFALLLLGVRCDAQSQFSTTLTTMEKSLFGVDYSTQADDARLKRIEEVVYGQSSSSSSSISQRVDKLSKDLSADLIGQEIKPKKDTFADDQDSYKENIPKADSSVNYPVVDNLEKQVFNKTFKTVDINQRLAKLEQNVFKKTYEDDLSTRVDRLKSAVMPQRVANNYNSDDEDENSYIPNNTTGSASSLQDDDFGTPGYNSSPSLNPQVPAYNSNNSVLDDYQSDSDIAIPLAALEKRVLKRSFPNDTISNRLTRLELKIFNSNFVDDDEQTRLDRVSSAYQAQKTSKKYDDNKFSQHMAAAMQVGAIVLMILAAVL